MRKWDGNDIPGIGDSVPRKEDFRLLTGRGRFSDDVSAPGQLHAVMLRSPHAHARILAIDCQTASRMPGVVAILTGEDARSDGLKPLPHNAILSGSLDIPLRPQVGEPFKSRQWVLPCDKVRYVGEAVAVIVAQSIAAARDAAAAVEVRYEALASTTRASDALRQDAPRLHETAPSNMAFEASIGDEAATAAAFARAAHRTRIITWIQRVTGVPMETRSALATYDTATGNYLLQAGSGNVVRQRRELATILDIPEANVRVMAEDVGGNFGTRNAFYPEFAIIAWLSRRTGRPIKWTCDRSEAFLSDYQGRDLEVEAEIALDAEGTIIGLRSINTSNVGAHSVSYGPLTKGCELMTSVYAIDAAHVTGRAVFTNTPPTNSYRSSGRPEAMFVMERLLDMAAREHGFDRVALRRRNLVPAAALPYMNAVGLTYDSGDYEKLMDLALEKGDWNGFPARKAEARDRGMLRGIAVANYVEISSGIPRERAEITIASDSRIEVVIGTLSSGQGHETSFAQLLTGVFGIGIDQVRLVTGDTARVSAGGGSHAGRSMRLAGVVIGKATEDIIARAKAVLAHETRHEASKISFSDARFHLAGTNESFDVFEVAAMAERSTTLPGDLRGPLTAVSDEVAKAAAFPFGSHVCEVEIDPETGLLEIVRYIAIDDVGRAVNPLILHGQAHGAITQGLGQAMSEICVFDAFGQPLCGSFMDYVMPRAHALPHFETIISEIPATTNPLGIRAGGEGGTTPALGVCVNAVCDALGEFGVAHLDMPLTPEKIWTAINTSRAPTLS